jgi:hypothetical protein
VSLIRSEPALVASVLAGGLTTGAAFGLPLSAGQIAAVGTFLTILAGLFVRTQVVPASKVQPIVPPPK